MVEKQQTAAVHRAKAVMHSLPFSTKQGKEICNFLRYKKTTLVKPFLEKVIALKTPVPYTIAVKDLGHKPGIGPGRFPQKAAGFFLQAVKSVEANAQYKGLDVTSLVISKILVNKAAIPFTGKRQQVKSKRTHIEIEVEERKNAAGKKKTTAEKVVAGKAASSKTTEGKAKKETKSPGAAPEAKTQ